MPRKKSKKRILNLKFPAAGYDESRALVDQAPYTTPSCLNVWPYDTFDTRARGGKRPGLLKAYSEQLGSGNPVRFMRAISTINATTGVIQPTLLASANGVVYIEESGSLVVFEGALGLESDATNEIVLESDGTTVLSLETSAQKVASDRYLSTAILGQKVFIADHSAVLDGGTDGTVSGFDLDESSGQDWSALGIDGLSHVVEITPNSGNTTTTAGVYYISTIQTTELTLTGQPGDGSVTYKIWRGVKVCDPADKEMSLLVPTTGTVPHGCPLIASYRDRLVLAGNPAYPNLWYMSRQGDPYDWNYSDDVSDLGRAMYGDGTGMQEARKPLTALIPRQDSYLIFASETSIEVMRGDPAAGGEMYSVSDTIGCIDKDAWCEGPDGEIYFMSRDGVYLIPAGPVGTPQSVSRERLPKIFRDIDTTTYQVLMEYDTYYRGIQIHITVKATDTYFSTSYFYSLETKSWWPQSFGSFNWKVYAMAHQPGDSNNDSRVLLGGQDGYIRYLDEDTNTDDGGNYSSTLMIGPIPLSPNGHSAGMITEMVATLEYSSDNVLWLLYTSDSAERAEFDTHGYTTGTWKGGERENWAYPRNHGRYATLTLSSGSGDWAYEEVQMVVRELGRSRTRNVP